MYAEDVVIFFTQLILFTLAEAAAAPLGLNVIIVASQGKGTEARAQEFRSYLLSTHADRHVVDISFTVCFLCVRRNFGNGYLGRGLAYSDEILQVGRPRSPPDHFPFW